MPAIAEEEIGERGKVHPAGERGSLGVGEGGMDLSPERKDLTGHQPGQQNRTPPSPIGVI